MKKHEATLRRCRRYRRQVLMVALLCTTTACAAGLAITEVLTAASTNLADQWVPGGGEYWELSNFGTHTVDLEGYGWSTRKGVPDSAPFAGVRITPGESIVFFRLANTATNAPAFRAWWGLADSVRVIPWGLLPKLNSTLDVVCLRDAEGGLVDHVAFGMARRGVAFTYDAKTGAFGAASEVGTHGAFKAVTADDVGSPGSTAGAVPPHILEVPASLEVDAGQDAVFTVRATAIPPPRYQWERDGTAIPGATSATLTITNVEPVHAGRYSVRVSNGCGQPASLSALLTVSTTPRPPSVLQGLRDVQVYCGQTAVFAVRARGYPTLSYRWRANGVDLPDETGATLVVSEATAVQSGTVYTVEVANTLGRAESSAELWVSPRPALFITEVMAAPSDTTRRDWWELTNLDTTAVRLSGWKFFDKATALDMNATCVITNDVTIQPGESILFVECATPESFVAWWGVTNLPPAITIIPYAGFGLSSSSDTLFLWSPAETNPWAPVASVMFAASTRGRSIQFTPNAWETRDSELGVDGATCAAASGDVGSPGYSHHAPPRFLRIAVEGEQVALTWQAVAGRRYALRSRPALAEPGEWLRLDTSLSQGQSVTVRLPAARSPGQRFYQVEALP